MTEVLDHGYLTLVDKWGSEEVIIEAARMSTGKGFKGWGPKCADCNYSAEGRQRRDGSNECASCDSSKTVAGDEKLLRFLWENDHHTPFEMAGATFEVQAPIFVFREWHRHRVPFSYNEMSARYAPLPNLSFLPDPETVVRRSQTAAQKNRQAGVVEGAEVLTLEAASDLLLEEADLLVMIEDLYQRKLKAGFPKELARTHLTVSRYSRMRASSNLRGWLAFLKLRAAQSAQEEIRSYAEKLHAELTKAFPRTLALFDEGRLKLG